MFVNFTSKQKQFINDIVNNKIKRINILEGSVRSGKTYVSLVAWIILLCKYEKTRNFLMVGKTVTSLKRNCLTLLEELCPKGTFSYSIVKKEAKLFGRRIFLEGVNDIRAELYSLKTFFLCCYPDCHYKDLYYWELRTQTHRHIG